MDGLSSVSPRATQMMAQRELEETRARIAALREQVNQAKAIPRVADAAAAAQADAAAKAAAADLKAAIEQEKALKELLRKLRLWWFPLVLGVLTVVSIVVALVQALQQPDGLRWLVACRPIPDTIGPYSSVLAPLLAVAVAVERLLEAFFDWFEQSVRTVADVISEARKPVGWIEQELKNAYDDMAVVAGKTGANATPAELALFASAEQRLAKAQQRMRDWVKEPNWVAFKRLFCIAVGLLVGNLVSISGDMGFLNMIGVPVPRILDMFATGLVIGAGPGPMHSLIGILQSGKNALDKVGTIGQGAEISDALADLKTQVAEVKAKVTP